MLYGGNLLFGDFNNSNEYLSTYPPCYKNNHPEELPQFSGLQFTLKGWVRTVIQESNDMEALKKVEAKTINAA